MYFICIILYYIVLYCIILYYIILYCIILYYIVLYYIILYYILYHIISCYIILYYIVLYYIILYCIILYYTILYIILYHIISCYIILYYICNWGTLQTTALTYCYSVFFLKKKWLWTTFQLGCPSLAEIWDLRSVLILQVLFAIVCPAAVSNWIHWDPGIHRMVLVIETTKFHQ